MGFLQGNVGVYAVASVIYDACNDKASSDQYLDLIRDIIKNRRYTIHLNQYRGLAGLLYTIEFLE